MWFKNLTLFRLPQPFDRDPERLAQALEPYRLKPCGSLEPASYGFSAPLGRLGNELVHAANGCILLTATREERVLPASVVRDTVDERIADIERRQPRTVRAKERRRIKEDVIHELLPRAFVKSAETQAYVSPRHGWLVVNSTVPKRVEDLLSLLGRALGTLEVVPLAAGQRPVPTFTGWLNGRPLPKGFTLQHDCELRDPADQASLVRFQRMDLRGAEMRVHLDARKEAHRIGVRFEERLRMLLNADLSVSRLEYEAVDEHDVGEDADDATVFDANFAFMTSELGRLIERLGETFLPPPDARPRVLEHAASV